MYRSHVLVCGGTGCTSSGSLKVLEALQTAAHRDRKAVLIVTHENEALKIADRVFRMNKGEIEPA